MIPLPLLDQLMAKVSSLLADSDLTPDVQNKAKTVLQSALSKMDLVTREEFDAQVAVLQKTRAKVDALEKIVADLEKQPAAK